MHRILVVDSSPCVGGATTSLAALLPLMVARGWAVQVLAYHGGALPLARRGVMNGGQRGLWWHVLPSPRADACHGMSYAGRELRRATTVANIARQMGPTLILANNGPLDNAGVGMAARRLRVPLVQYVRGRFHAGRLAGPALRMASLVLTVGAEAHAAVLACGIPSSRVRAVAEGLDARQWPARRSGNGWLWAGVLTPWKGLDLMLDAWTQLNHSVSPASLDVCYVPMPPGHPDEVAIPEAPVGVRMHRAPPDLDAIRQNCSVYVHTALQPEPFGRAIIEAMAAGLCPVVPDQGTCTQLVQHNVNGLVYRMGDAESLRAALLTLARDEPLRGQLGSAAANCSQRYRADTAFTRLVGTFERLSARA